MRTFQRALQRDALIFTAQLPLAGESRVNETIAQAASLAEYFDGIQLAENLRGQAHISAVALSALLLREGIDPIPSLICRDRNRIALKSDLLGLKAIGVSSVVLNEGGQFPAGQAYPAKAVFDVNGREYIGMAHAINEEIPGNPEQELLIGTTANVCAPGADWNPEPLLARASAGARFLQTQPCFDSQSLRRYMDRLVEEKVTWNYAIIATIAPLPSAASARRLKENIGETLLPVEIIERLESAPHPEQEGIEICTELIHEIQGIPGISGINLMVMDNPEAVLEVKESTGL